MKKKDAPPPVARTPPPPPPRPEPPPLPRAQAEPPPPALVVETRAEKPVKVLPWVTLGASLVATGVGVFFAVRTRNTIEDQAELEFEINTSKSRVKIPEEFTDNQKAVFINSITATVLISAGISGAIASTVALSMD